MAATRQCLSLPSLLSHFWPLCRTAGQQGSLPLQTPHGSAMGLSGKQAACPLLQSHSRWRLYEMWRLLAPASGSRATKRKALNWPALQPWLLQASPLPSLSLLPKPTAGVGLGLWVPLPSTVAGEPTRPEGAHCLLPLTLPSCRA